MSKKGSTKNGKCRVCGHYGKLSFEHIPPQSVGNVNPARKFNMADLIEKNHSIVFDADAERYDVKTCQGAGGYFLCRGCNSYFGRYYVPSYTRLSEAVLPLAGDYYKPNAYRGAAKFPVVMNPLGLVKQVLANFVCLTQPGSMDDCHDYLLDHDSTDLPRRLRLLTAITPMRNPDQDGVRRLVSTGWCLMYTTCTAFQTAFLSLPPLSFMLIDEELSAKGYGLSLPQMADITKLGTTPWGEKLMYMTIPYMIGFPTEPSH